MREPTHLIIVGGGLAGGLVALALRARASEVRVTIVEPGDIGGNHLWSFFAGDVDAEAAALLAPLVEKSWSDHDVIFPSVRRRLAEAYSTIPSARLAEAVAASGCTHVRQRAAALEPRSVTLADGSRIEGDALIDCRGLDGLPDGLEAGWQKFVGRRFAVDHDVARPVVMDATVAQADGYRFVYLLPFGGSDLFVEDTYYADTPDLDAGALRGRIDDYLAARGLSGATMTAEETGVLPVVFGGDFDRFWPASDRIARGGVRAGLFHPLTSYSLPDAVRFACWLAPQVGRTHDLAGATRDHAKSHWKSRGFERMLARMLFKAAAPDERYRVLERFYRLPLPLIRRFYAGRLTALDKMRILVGRPPVPIGRALKAILS